MSDAAIGRAALSLTTLTMSSLSNNAARALPHNLALEFGVLATSVSDTEMTVACSQPLAAGDVARLARATGKRITTTLVEAHLLAPEIARCYGGAPSYQEGEESTTILMVDALLQRAVVERASDVHLALHEQTLGVRMRVDGVLRDFETIEKPTGARIFSRIKLIAGLDIAERRLPQDGRLQFQFQERDIDVRVASLPTNSGERLALRLFDTETVSLNFQQLGMLEETTSAILPLLRASSGLVLICGPTGSGKTTTLYAALEHLDRNTRHICSVEDPVERRLAGMSQVSIQPKSGLSFAIALRALLRQDPDVIMIGEIRDHETAQTAVQAALAGQLVLASVHSANAYGAIERMRELGIRPSSLAAVLAGILAQRLLRRLCDRCKAPQDDEYIATGCLHCADTGYRGRAPLFDVLLPDGGLRRKLSHDRIEMAKIRPVPQRMASEYLRDGITTRDEIERVASLWMGESL